LRCTLHAHPVSIACLSWWFRRVHTPLVLWAVFSAQRRLFLVFVCLPGRLSLPLIAPDVFGPVCSVSVPPFLVCPVNTELRSSVNFSTHFFSALKGDWLFDPVYDSFVVRSGRPNSNCSSVIPELRVICCCSFPCKRRFPPNPFF